ncbi:transmembrane adaptor Erv26-domain-containing protein [Amylostereum chailletii]|nr:transmembrane adaptor Erv26-domain-containing protein [Amylostereum chailletii]
MPILHLLSYGAAVVAFLFTTLSLASGLLWLSELIEEHSRLSKTVGMRGIYAIIVLHLVLAFADGLPLPKILFSIFCHLVYLRNFSKSWPFISLTSLTFVASCILVIADHFLWFFHFARITHQARQTSRMARNTVRGPTFGDMATFFGICVWLAPLFLFLSLSANDNALPTATGMIVFRIPGTPTSPSHSSPPKPQPPPPRTSLFRSLVDVLPFEYVPRLRGRPAREGIIAPHSPVIHRSPSPIPLSPTFSLNNLPPTPTRSASHDALVPSFQLHPPPRRSASLMGEPPSPPTISRRR